MGFINYIIAHSSEILELLLAHIQLTVIAVGLAILVGVPVGILICYIARMKRPVLGLASLIQAIPSMALLGFAIPLLGIGNLPAVVVVTLYSLLPIIKNTVTGISSIPKDTIEAARGIGLTRFQILRKIEIPMALPVIMAGVRISAVTAVGLMTMAAFIGGDGLGYLVFSGIRTVNNYQILAGAIPACLLALFVDFLCSIIERLITPKSMQSKKDKEISKFKDRFQKLILVATASAILILGGIGLFQNNKTSDKVITIGSKDFTEQVLISEMISQLIEENTDIQVIRKQSLGGTQVAYGAIVSGDIDMYVEYTGTAYVNLLKHEPSTDVDKVYEETKDELYKKHKLVAFDQMGFNNTYTLAVREDTAKKYNLKTFEDIKTYSPELALGGTLEFSNRPDGMPGLISAYGYTFKNTIAIDGSSRYIALENDEIQVVDAFATDGMIKKYGLVVLEDNKHFFAPYYAMPLIREETYEKYPEIEALIGKLGKSLDNKTMIELNYRIDELQEDPAVVAKEYLQQHGFIK